MQKSFSRNFSFNFKEHVGYRSLECCFSYFDWIGFQQTNNSSENIYLLSLKKISWKKSIFCQFYFNNRKLKINIEKLLQIMIF